VRERTKRGTGSIRERTPGVWEIRVVVGFDTVHAQSVQRSFTVRGDEEAAEQRRRELVGDFGIRLVAAVRATFARFRCRACRGEAGGSGFGQTPLRW
jgi:hypothetical protein